MLNVEIIKAKRDGNKLTDEQISQIIVALTNGSLSEGQAAAFAMAVYFKGMDAQEAVSLTLAMRDSGDVMEWEGLDGPIIDKHSTGGIGDNVSLILAPIMAACGVYTPMISGRGLGHTGGTLDKLDAIPGYNTQPDSTLFDQTLRNCGCAIVGQTALLAPADKRLYAIRDVTATVESIPLITASILSKKFAAGLEGLVMDVKCGNGTFMNDIDEARVLARSLVDVANGGGLKTTALITDMNQPLANCAGNALEVINAIEVLTGKISAPRLLEVVISLASEMLVSGAKCLSIDEGRQQALCVLNNGKAGEHFAKMVAFLGGPSDLLENYRTILPKAPVVMPFLANSDGYVSSMQTREIGMAVVKMGGGRAHPADQLDYSVGIADILPKGSAVVKGEPIAQVHARNETEGKDICQYLNEFIKIDSEKVAEQPPIIERIV